MRLGIVGAEALKFTQRGRLRARFAIYDLISRHEPSEVVSGACHLGGIDIWAVEIATRLGIATTEYPPAIQAWAGGYRERNLSIVARSDVVVCITVDALPPGFDGMRFERCYHCGTTDHVKSGGCWTARKALSAGKRAEWITINNAT